MKIIIEEGNLSPNRINRLKLDMEYFFKTDFSVIVKGDNLIFQDN